MCARACVRACVCVCVFHLSTVITHHLCAWPRPRRAYRGPGPRPGAGPRGPGPGAPDAEARCVCPCPSVSGGVCSSVKQTRRVHQLTRRGPVLGQGAVTESRDQRTTWTIQQQQHGGMQPCRRKPDRTSSKTSSIRILINAAGFDRARRGAPHATFLRARPGRTASSLRCDAATSQECERCCDAENT